MMRHLSRRSCALGLSPPLHMTISWAPRACSWAMTDCILDDMPSLVAICGAAGTRLSVSAARPGTIAQQQVSIMTLKLLGEQAGCQGELAQ